MTDMAERPDVERALARIREEYLEMPGMRLTLPQACRLFGLDEPAGRRALETLVNAAFLRCAGGSYARADSGREAL
jgi:hypothetical protein